MLTISAGQLRTLDYASREDFENRAIASVRNAHPDETSSRSDDELRITVRERTDRALSYGLTSERQIMCFIHTSFVHGEHFDSDGRHKWAMPLLKSAEMPADAKAAWLLEFACAGPSK
jgi:hypothetical protein